ncbi:MAG: hypothetical protein JJU33_04550 [Phycisphaerales bacterium]|nr:hypothetical protein [Phycisphaerales bacterium]
MTALSASLWEAGATDSICGSGSMALCNDFRAVSNRIWEIRKTCASTEFDPSETTFTELFLWTIREWNSTSVQILPFSPRRESANGADWEWWFFDSTECFGMRVQAKRFTANRHYKSIGYRKMSQIQQLIKSAASPRREQLYPIYCFYNWFECDHGCGLFDRYCPGDLGCTTASAESILRLSEEDSNWWRLDRIGLISKPLHLLVCGKESQGKTLPHFVRDSLERNGIDDGDSPVADIYGSDIPDIYSISEAPVYAQRAMYDQLDESQTKPDQVQYRKLHPDYGTRQCPAGIVLFMHQS